MSLGSSNLPRTNRESSTSPASSAVASKRPPQVRRPSMIWANSVAVVDILLCATHGLCGLAFAIELFTKVDGRWPMRVGPMSYLELATALVIGLVGVVANCGLLAKQRWGLNWAYVLILTTVVSLVAGFT